MLNLSGQSQLGNGNQKTWCTNSHRQDLEPMHVMYALTDLLFSARVSSLHCVTYLGCGTSLFGTVDDGHYFHTD